MTNKRRLSYVLFSIFLVFTGMQVFADGKPEKKEKVRMMGAVVARVISATSLAALTSVPNEQILLVRIRQEGKEQEPKYIKVIYQRWHNEPELPAELLNSKSLWSFRLVRSSICDGTLKSLLNVHGKTEGKAGGLVPQLIPTSGAEAEAIPQDNILPCYLLRPGNLRRQNNK